MVCTNAFTLHIRQSVPFQILVTHLNFAIAITSFILLPAPATKETMFKYEVLQYMVDIGLEVSKKRSTSRIGWSVRHLADAELTNLLSSDKKTAIVSTSCVKLSVTELSNIPCATVPHSRLCCTVRGGIQVMGACHDHAIDETDCLTNSSDGLHRS